MTSIGVYANPEKCDARREHDFYPTPWEATEALMKSEAARIRKVSGGRLWEPACGDGSMSEVLKAHGFSVLSTDLIDRGYKDGFGGVNFLTQGRTPDGPKVIVTNPPFDISEGFIRHALGTLGVPYMALLLKAQYFHADCRLPLFRQFRPARVYPCGWRIDFTGGGSNHMDCSWFIWDGRDDWTEYCDPLEKPTVRGMANLI